MATRTPRIYDVARSARVSIATVSRVANGTARVDERTEARVRRAMERLGYRPHALARGLATRRSHTLGLLITDILDPYFAEIVRGAQERAESAGYVVLLVKRLLERRVDGLIVASSRTTDAYAAQLASEDIPVVCINGPLGQFAHAVQIDHRKGARLAVEHLASLGHTRIAHITGAVGVPTRQERLAGYRAALKDLGLSYDPSLVIAGVTSIADSHDAVAGLLGLAAAPTAIFAFNDRWAIGAYAAVRDAGLRIPADVSVVGFDDLEMDEWVQPALTSVRQPRREMGRIAADVLLAVLAGESASELVVVEPSLVIRGSTGTRRAHADRH